MPDTTPTLHRRRAIREAIERLVTDLNIVSEGLADESTADDVALALEHLPLSLTTFTQTIASLDVT